MAWKNELIKSVKPKLNSLDVAHNFDHSLRVFENCKIIGQEFKNVNYDALYAASILHDIGQTVKHDNEHGHNSVKLARIILNKIKFPSDIDLVLEVIKKHDDYRWVKNHSGTKPNIPEAKIFQDADRLESMGAMGIIRQFLWAGKHGKRIYDEKARPRPDLIYGGNISAIHTIRDHEINIYKNLNTKAAKRLAKQKQEFKKIFLKQFFKEWNFKYLSR